LKRGNSVSIVTWNGRERSGTVCDWEQIGLLLDVSERGDSAGGNVFLPWSGIEQTEIREVSQRWVRFLPSWWRLRRSLAVFPAGSVAGRSGE
jgi:hypothetical protein